MNNNQTQTVADRRLEEWLTQWGEVECERIHGGILPDKRGTGSNTRPNRQGIPNLAACYADVSKYVGKASPIVRQYLIASYALQKYVDVGDFVVDSYGRDIPEQFMQQVIRRVRKNFNEWRKDTAAALNL
jgi:hypothetical protein